MFSLFANGMSFVKPWGVWNPRPGGKIEIEQTDGQHDSQARTIRTFRAGVYGTDAEVWHQDGKYSTFKFSCSMRREVCREKLVYLDLVRTFPNTRNSIQHSSMGVVTGRPRQTE